TARIPPNTPIQNRTVLPAVISKLRTRSGSNNDARMSTPAKDPAMKDTKRATSKGVYLREDIVDGFFCVS
ncbi:10122_t:CDS:2, partial [Acaulospora colombiana]